MGVLELMLTLVSIPVSGAKVFHSGIYDSDIPLPGVVALEVGQPDTVLVRGGISSVELVIGQMSVEEALYTCSSKGLSIEITRPTYASKITSISPGQTGGRWEP